MLIFALGFLVHVIFLLSIFDAYFKSPLLNDLPVIENSIGAPAKRIVLISSDGLRASSAFGHDVNSTPNAPYLRSVIQTEASWGVCHTRVPTESRPGHIAMIAGFYEDPSAIFKGWTDNIFEFDSLFNRSALTLGWGSPDIVPMFNKGNLSKQMIMKSYPYEMQELFGSGESILALNSWVFNEVNETLNIAEFNSSGKQLRESLNQSKVFLFLHLLATDTSGHSDKPQSQEFFNVLKETDANIELIIERLEKFYNHDGKTVYVFTSDHGMTDWGTHGDGSNIETETPFVIWGPGVKKPKLVNETDKNDLWRLSHLIRRDLRQADVVPLLATLLGISIPVHSVGVLPMDFLDVSDGEKAKMLELNMKQINQQFLKSRDSVKLSSTSFFYIPFKDLTDELDAEMKNAIKNHIINHQYHEAISLSQKLIHLNLAAINYYQNYYQYLLLGCISVSYFGWIFVLLTVLCKNLQLKPGGPKSAKLSFLTMLSRLSPYAFTVWFVITISFIIVQSLPIQFYIYGLLPVFLWWFAFKHNALNVFEGFAQTCYECWYLPIAYAVGVEFFVLTFFQRWAISAVTLALVFWPWFHLPTLRRQKCQFLVYMWTCSTLGIAIFPFLPVTGFEANIFFVVISGLLSIVFNVSILLLPVLNHCFILKPEEGSSGCYLSLGTIRHIWALLASFLVCVAMYFNLSVKYCQIVSWILLGNAIIIPVNMMKGDVSLRLVGLFLSMTSPMLLLSIGHESLFYFLFSAHLLIWFALEYQLVSRVCIGGIGDGTIGGISGNTSRVTWRRAFFFLTFLLMSFFGAGNIASVSSFDLLTVQRFISVFSPFTMMSLILLKLLIPFLLVVATVFCLYIKIHDSINELLLVVFIFCDLLGLHFLFLVKNVGSWKEIGTSLSHYVIVESIILFISLLLGVAHFYLKELSSNDILTSVGARYLSGKTYRSNKKNY
nr:PREDICTED: GPI ethanolamine phosphate transferase 1 [Bemisia tabaci]